MSQLSIKVNIAGRTYPLTIERSEEEMIRKAADNINQSIKEFQNNYAVKDIQDLLAMTALQIGAKSVAESKEVENKHIIDDLTNIEKELDSILND